MAINHSKLHTANENGQLLTLIKAKNVNHTPLLCSFTRLQTRPTLRAKLLLCFGLNYSNMETRTPSVGVSSEIPQLCMQVLARAKQRSATRANGRQDSRMHGWRLPANKEPFRLFPTGFPRIMGRAWHLASNSALWIKRKKKKD